MGIIVFICVGLGSQLLLSDISSKVDNLSWGQPEGFLFNSFYTDM